MITATFTGPRRKSLFPKAARPAAPCATYCYAGVRGLGSVRIFHAASHVSANDMFRVGNANNARVKSPKTRSGKYSIAKTNGMQKDDAIRMYGK